tara:strand:- start:2329 stop:4506 length:2178 start_codon:yes stop_codon:yes gene_type:complete
MAGGNGVPQNTGMVGQQMMGGLKPGPGTFGPTSQVPFNPNIQNVVSPTPGTGTLGPALPSGGVEELGRQSIPLIPPGGFPPPGGPSTNQGPVMQGDPMDVPGQNPGSGGGKGGGSAQPPNINQSAARGIQGAMAGAGREMMYQPLNVNSSGYGASQGRAQGYGAARTGAQGYGATRAGARGFEGAGVESTGYGSQGYNPAQTGSQGYGAERTGATGFEAERIAASPVVQSRDVAAGQLGSTNLGQYTNPYESQVVQSTLSDLDRARQMSLNDVGAQATAAGAFGGSRQGIMESETNRAFADQAAKSAGQLRQAGFNQAQGMAQQDIATRMQAGLANQQAGLQAGTTTANLAQQAALANQSAGMRASEFGASSANQASLANQAAANQASQFGASAQNQAAAQASAQQQAASQFGASAANQAALANQNALNQAGQFGAQAANQASQFGASAQNQAAAQASAQQQAASQFGAQAGNTAALTNAAAMNQANQFGAQAGNVASLSNQAALNQARQFGSSAANTQMMNNQNAINQSRQFNAQQSQAAQLANQQAGLAGSGQRLGAAGQLGSLSNLGFGMGQTVNQNLAQQGMIQQAIQQQLIDAAKAQFEGYRQSPYQSIGLLSQALGASPIPQSQQTRKDLGATDYLTMAAGLFGSDARLKTNINQVGNLPNGLGLYTWDWTEDAIDKGLDNHMTLGVIAQEVEKVMPEMVVTTPSGYMAVNYGELYKDL